MGWLVTFISGTSWLGNADVTNFSEIYLIESISSLSSILRELSFECMLMQLQEFRKIGSESLSIIVCYFPINLKLSVLCLTFVVRRASVWIRLCLCGFGSS